VIVGVPTEHAPGEHRVALTPDAVPRLAQHAVRVLVEPGAGAGASLPDDDYREAGAEIAADSADLLARADIVVRVGRVERDEVAALRSATTLVGYLRPLAGPELVQALAGAGVTGFSMEAIPRVTRAQRMDSLSSQATVGGYRAVILAAEALPKFFPMLMTAAGTVPPAKVLILGAGVAGLQAIATARRLGAVVSAFDTRPAVKEQVLSLGATFVELEMEVGETAQDARGYATVLSESQQVEQQRMLERHVADSDVVITTAAVPGQRAPRLIPASVVEEMRTGSVIVDLAAETGGNCELTEPGEVVERHGVKLIGTLNLPAGMPLHASQMYARNIQAVLEHLVVDGALALDFDDEITADAVITHEGRVTSRLLQEATA
jgi:NAD(P) transhydrogenase subunit alpha